MNAYKFPTRTELDRLGPYQAQEQLRQRMEQFHDPSKIITFFDDFFVAPTDENLFWHETDDGTTGTNAVTDGLGGLGTVVTAAADNDYHAIDSLNECFQLVSGKPLWFEARFVVTDGTALENTWWFGLTDTLTTGGMQANALGPLASYDGILIYKTPETAWTINMEASNAGVQLNSAAFATGVSGTYIKVAFYYDGVTTITPYYNVGGTALMTAGASVEVPTSVATMAAMHVVAGIKAGPSDAVEKLTIDYIKVWQVR